MIKIFARKIDLEVPVKLRGLVLAFIVGESGEEIQERIPIFPTGFPLIVNVFGTIPKMTINGKIFQPKSRTVLAGQMENVKIHSDFHGVYGQVGIILHPTAAYYLFHQKGVGLKNTWTPLDEISPMSCGGLAEKLAKKDLSKGERFRHLLIFLNQLEEQRLPCIEWLENSLLKIYEQNGNIDQRDLHDSSGVCARHFRRVFKNVIGVPPKYFCKVVQMNTAFEALKEEDPQKLHHIALDCGYYDQSHFINDFRNMFGLSPEKFLNGKHSYIRNFMGRRGT